MAAGELRLPAVSIHEVEQSIGVETVELPIAANDNVRSDYYVYAWLRPTGEPFYVGKGRGRRDRAPKNANPIFTRIVAKIGREGGAPSVVRLHENLIEPEAHRLEREEIARHGRLNIGTGILANLTGGGEGNSGWSPSSETRAKIGASHAGKTLDASHRTTLALIARNPSEATRAKMSASQTGRKHSEATIEKMRSNNAMLNPEHRAKVAAALAGRPKSREHRAALSAAKASVGPETRAAISAANRMRPPSSGFKGVSWNSQAGKWKAAIRLGDKRPFLGYFENAEDAARAYDRAAVAAWGEGNCYLNLPTDALLAA